MHVHTHTRVYTHIVYTPFSVAVAELTIQSSKSYWRERLRSLKHILRIRDGREDCVLGVDEMPKGASDQLRMRRNCENSDKG